MDKELFKKNNEQLQLFNWFLNNGPLFWRFGLWPLWPKKTYSGYIKRTFVSIAEVPRAAARS